VLWHLEKAVEYIKRDCSFPLIYYSVNQEYKYPLRYLLGLEGVGAVSLKNYDPDQKGCFYALDLTRSKRGVDSGIKENFGVVGQEKFGALSVYKLEPGEEFLNKSGSQKEKQEKKRIFWKDVFEKLLEK
jgi:hypothetical protein